MVETWPEELYQLRARFQSNETRRGDQESNGSQKTSNSQGQPKQRRKISSDGVVFKMHYQFTSTLLLASAMFLASNLGLGSPITCIGDAFGLDQRDVQVYCMLNGVKIVHPFHQEVQQEQSQSRGWFIWTPIILLIQSVLFYIPHWIWKHRENGWIDGMLQDMRRSDLADETVVKERKKLAAESLRKGRNTNTVYGTCLILCQLLNWFNVTVQLYALNAMLSYYFFKNPISAIMVVSDLHYARFDPLEWAFPKTVSCTMKAFGPAGGISTRSILCDVAVNHFNEMCCILMWYWFVFLLAVTTLSCLANITLVITPYYMKSALKVSNRGVAPHLWNKIFRKFGSFDLLVLKTMLDEMYPKMAEEFVKELADQISLYTIQLPHDEYI